MTRKRKLVSRPSMAGRSALKNLQTVGKKLNHPLLAIDFDLRQKHRHNQDPILLEAKRLICFSRIPACCLSAKGSGASDSIADESAAHAMLDFFRLAISHEFVGQLQACADDEAVDALVPQVAKVFEEFHKAIDADYLLIKRCAQLEISSASTIRGREVKKRVLQNLRNPSIGYASASSILQQNRAQEVVTLEDDDDHVDASKANEVTHDSRPSSTSSDCVIINEVNNETQESRVAKPAKNRLSKTASPKSLKASKSPSPELKELRELDEGERSRLVQERQKLRQFKEAHNSLQNYFGDANKSNAGPPEVFCCLPNMNRVEFAEAQSSEESEDEGANVVPKKRIKLNNEDDPVVLNMSTSSEILDAAGASGDPGNQIISHDKDSTGVVSDSEDEIGDIVDEWNEVDDNGDSKEIEVVDIKDEEEVTTTTTQNGTKNGFYDGHLTHQSFIESRRLPVNYQAKTIGVVVNEKLCRAVEKFVGLTTEKNFTSIKQLTKLTWVHYRHNVQDDGTYLLKQKAREILEKEIQKVLKDRSIKLLITGSTINGCGSYNSDMDMCLCYPTLTTRGTTFEDFYCDRSHSTKVLRKVHKSVYADKFEKGIRKVICKCSFIPAKVPIIKCLLTKAYAHVDVDINVNNIAGVYNSHLTHYYSLVDARFPALALVVKHWAFVAGIGNAPDGYLNSYTIILLVIHYLQCGVTPAVLPNLQYLFPDLFDRKIPLDELRLFGDISSKLPTSVPNTWSLGELLVGFFYYYKEFDFKNQAISIRSAQVVPRSSLPRDTFQCSLFIEEPFDAINTARSVRTSVHMNEIKAQFRRASEMFSHHHRRFDLADIGVDVRE